MDERLLKWFDYKHLPPHLQEVSRQFHDLALWITWNLPEGPERTLALGKLVEAKDWAVRAKVASNE